MDQSELVPFSQRHEVVPPAVALLLNMVAFKADERVVGDLLGLQGEFVGQGDVVFELLVVLKLVLKVVAVEEVVEVGDVGLVEGERQCAVKETCFAFGGRWQGPLNLMTHTFHHTSYQHNCW